MPLNFLSVSYIWAIVNHSGKPIKDFKEEHYLNDNLNGINLVHGEEQTVGWRQSKQNPHPRTSGVEYLIANPDEFVIGGRYLKFTALLQY